VFAVLWSLKWEIRCGVPIKEKNHTHPHGPPVYNMPHSCNRATPDKT
jgi:hypothetical protein